MPPRPKRAQPAPPPRSAEVLDVHSAAALLMVSADTVYDLFGRGELPGRKVGRKQPTPAPMWETHCPGCLLERLGCAESRSSSFGSDDCTPKKVEVHDEPLSLVGVNPQAMPVWYTSWH